MYIDLVLSCDFSMFLIEKNVRQAVTGITLPSGSDKLYSGSEDETVRVWDCQSGQVVPVVISASFLQDCLIL